METVLAFGRPAYGFRCKFFHVSYYHDADSGEIRTIPKKMDTFDLTNTS
jgi:hypothetical protein